MNRLVRASTFAGLLGVHRSTLIKWNADGRLPYDLEVAHADHYYESTIDRFLAGCKYNTGRTLRYDDLVSGRVVLISKPQAMELTGLKHAPFRTRIELGQLEGVLAKRDWQVTQQSLEEYLRITRYTVEMTGHIIGLAPNAESSAMYMLLRRGVLVRHPFSHSKGTYITEESIDRYLRDHLPKWSIVSEWREERLQDPRPLLSAQQIAHYLNRRARERVNTMLLQERLSYVWRPQKTVRLYSPTAFDTYMDLERRPNDAEIGHWFGVHPTMVSKWRGLSLVHCPLGQHDHPPRAPLYEACWREIIEGQLSPGIGGFRWISTRKHSPHPLLGRMLAAAKLGISPDEVVEHAEAGRLKGIRTLTGEWRFSRHAVRNFRPPRTQR